MRLTVSHRYDFGPDRERIGRDLVRPEGWDEARETSGPFGLPATREEWERAADRPDLRTRASDIARVARSLEARRICSHGAGTGMLELQLVRVVPDVKLTCTDYAPRTVGRLRALFPEADVLRHDLLRDEPLGADLHLMHRLDTELSNADWKRVFPRYAEPILLVPGIVLTAVTAARELARALLHPRSTHAGWARNEDALRDLWRDTHDDRPLRLAGAPAFLLTRR